VQAIGQKSAVLSGIFCNGCVALVRVLLHRRDGAGEQAFRDHRTQEFADEMLPVATAKNLYERP